MSHLPSKKNIPKASLNRFPVHQRVMGTVFAGMGLATMAFPHPILRLGVQPKYLGTITPPLVLMTRCFGSQATLCGILLLTTRMTKRAYRTFGLAMIPYFIFDVWAWRAGACTTLGAIGDGLGNVVFSVSCWIGWNEAKQEGRGDDE